MDPMGKDVRTAGTLDEFKRTDLRTREILGAEPVPSADHLFRVTAALGEDWRHVVAGLAQSYAPQALHRRSVFPRSFEDSGGR